MLFHTLHVLPTPKTLDYLSAVLSSAPIDIDLNSMSVMIMASQFEIQADPTLLYRATSQNVKMVYNAELESSSLIMSLDSGGLERRYMMLQDAGAKDAFYDYYYPHMAIVKYMPSLSNPTKRFVVSMSNIFADSKEELVFGNEICVTSDLSYPPDYNYQQMRDEERNTGVSRVNYSDV